MVTPHTVPAKVWVPGQPPVTTMAAICSNWLNKLLDLSYGLWEALRPAMCSKPRALSTVGEAPGAACGVSELRPTGSMDVQSAVGGGLGAVWSRPALAAFAKANWPMKIRRGAAAGRPRVVVAELGVLAQVNSGLLMKEHSWRKFEGRHVL
jgi:hypothetical protein